jgi:hypothetical protein
MTKQQKVWSVDEVIAAMRGGIAIPDDDLVNFHNAHGGGCTTVGFFKELLGTMPPEGEA